MDLQSVRSQLFITEFYTALSCDHLLIGYNTIFCTLTMALSFTMFSGTYSIRRVFGIAGLICVRGQWHILVIELCFWNISEVSFHLIMTVCGNFGWYAYLQHLYPTILPIGSQFKTMSHNLTGIRQKGREGGRMGERPCGEWAFSQHNPIHILTKYSLCIQWGYPVWCSRVMDKNSEGLDLNSCSAMEHTSV